MIFEVNLPNSRSDFTVNPGPTRIFSNALSYCKFATSLKRRFNSSLFRFRFQALIEAFNFSDDLAVIPNLLSVGKSGDHVCPICNSRFTNIGNFKQHMKTHDTDHLRDQRNQIISEMVATCYGDLLWFLLLVLLDEITTTVKVETATGVNWGGCHNSVVSSVPTILGLRVWLQGTLSMLFQFSILLKLKLLLLEWEKDENKWKRGRYWSIF